jgi:hypothetical protein
MCPQTVGLVQGALETAGITTTGVTNVAEVSEKVGVPRALDVPWRLGFTLGEPNNAELQREVLVQALALTDRDDIPVLEAFELSEPGQQSTDSSQGS